MPEQHFDHRCLAGVVGFEPTVHGTKNRCLTAWLHPNSGRLATANRMEFQALSRPVTLNSLLFRCVLPQEIGALPIVLFGIDHLIKRWFNGIREIVIGGRLTGFGRCCVGSGRLVGQGGR